MKRISANEWPTWVGVRAICTDWITRIARDEYTFLEVSPGGTHVKVRNELNGIVSWKDTSSIDVLERLPPKPSPPAKEAP